MTPAAMTDGQQLILIVEDSATQREELRYLLEKHRFKVAAAADGQEALALLERERPIAVISDIVMPGMDGYELCRRIKGGEAHLDIPVILLTSLSDPEDVITGLECGADFFIMKPYNEQFLLSRIQHILANQDLTGEHSARMGLEISFRGKKYFINSDRLQILNLLLSTYETAIQKNQELVDARQEMEQLNEQLEEVVARRTADLQTEIEGHKAAEQKLTRINRLYTVLGKINEAIIRIREPERLFQEACRIIVEDGALRMAWVGACDAEHPRVRPVAHFGHEDGYLTRAHISIDPAIPEGEGPTGLAFREKRYIINDDTEINPVMAPWREEALRRGYLSSASLPLIANGDVIAIMTIYAPEPYFFKDEEQQLLSSLSDDLAFAIESMKTEKKKKAAEEELKRASVYNRSLIEASLDPLVTINAAGKITDVNIATETATGCSRDELIGTDFSEYFTDPARARAGYQQVFNEETVHDYALEIKHHSGTVTPVLYNAALFRDDAGEVLGVFAAARDITELKRAERELRQVKNYLANIVDAMPTILVGLDEQEAVTQWSREAVRHTGIPAEQASGRPVQELLPDFAPWLRLLREKITKKAPVSVERVVVSKGDESFLYDLMLYPLDHDGMGGAVLRIDDVTERARVQDVMVQTEKMISLGGLAAGMAHEINNPLGIINQAVQNLDRRLTADLPGNREAADQIGLDLERLAAYCEKRQLDQFIASIREATARASTIVTNMLQFSRQSSAAKQPLLLPDLVEQAVALAANDYDLKKKYDFRSIQIQREYDPNLPPVPVVAVEIQQVLLNLLKNAAQAMNANPPGRQPQITVRLRRDGKYALLEMEDNGPGMDEHVRLRIFEPFFTTKEPGAGTGLGLSVSYMIVTNNHKGFITVDSSPGSGARFFVRLPLQEQPQENNAYGVAGSGSIRSLANP